VRDGVLAEENFYRYNKTSAAQNKALNDAIAKSWKDLINAKPRLAKMEQDSAAAFKRCETTFQDLRKTYRAGFRSRFRFRGRGQCYAACAQVCDISGRKRKQPSETACQYLRGHRAGFAGGAALPDSAR